MTITKSKPRRRVVLWVSAGLLAVVAVAVALLPRTGTEATPAAADPAPSVEFRLFDGSEASLADFRGTPVVLNFWASWCPACVAEMPSFQEVHRTLGDRVTFIGLDVQDDRSAAERFVADTGVTYLIGEDPDGSILGAFDGIAMPTTIFIDREGNVVSRQSGAIFEDDLTERIQELFFDA